MISATNWQLLARGAPRIFSSATLPPRQNTPTKSGSGLQENGIIAWIAPESIPTGSSYILKIPRVISSVRAILLLLTREAQDSRWVRKEVGSAIGAGKLLLPMKINAFSLNPEMSFLLEGEQFYPIWERDEAQQIPAIIQEVRTKLQS